MFPTVKTCLLLAALAAFSAVSAVTEETDCRTRTYVWPKRIVWQSPPSAYGCRRKVEKPERLLGDAPDAALYPNILKRSGCFLENRGEPAGILLDYGREIHGGLQIAVSWGCAVHNMKLRVRFGESVSEAMGDVGEKGATNDHAIRDSIVDVPASGTREIGDTGFRFVRVDLVTEGRLPINALRAISVMRPMKRVGSFRCSDERINRVFETSVHTVHLCCQSLLWDGIKRDRAVWMGDTYPETMAILAVFGGAEVLPQSLDYMAAVEPPGSDMNTIRAYTLWWIRNVAAWYDYTGDMAYLAKHRDYLGQTVAAMAKHVTSSNTFNGGRMPFLDWPSRHNAPATASGVNALAATAFDEAARLEHILGESELETLCREKSRILRQRLNEPYDSKQAASMLALSGMRDPKEMFHTTLGEGGHAGVSTFYGYFMLEAISAAGENQRALETVRDYWGAMLDMGATSFWENFDIAWTNNAFRLDELPVPGKRDIHGDFGEFCYPGLRHSLCHGWSAGPAAWLIHHVLGIRSIAYGCTAVEVKPFLGDLNWAEGAMATPHGPVRVRVEKQPDGTLKTTVDAPREVQVVRN